jgi:hypothetical protein
VGVSLPLGAGVSFLVREAFGGAAFGGAVSSGDAFGGAMSSGAAFVGAGAACGGGLDFGRGRGC